MSQLIVTRADFRVATDEDKHLDTYDNTKLVAINTCPTWGILRYQMHKTFQHNSRAMALEAGSTMHEVFAWVRLCQLYYQTDYLDIEVRMNAFHHHGKRLFNSKQFPGRWLDILQAINNSWDQSNPIDYVREGALNVIETGAFYDDPNDKRRTISNLSECALHYCDRWDFSYNVWMQSKDDPFGLVGLEMPFDIRTDLTMSDGSVMSFRLTGMIDGIHDYNGRITLHENKTASRLNEAWSSSYHLNSQPTHYLVAVTTIIQAPVRNALIIGLNIPLPKSSVSGGMLIEPVRRHDYHIERWINWVAHTVQLAEEYKDNPYDAPNYTHSCNRYFRPCSFIPFCNTTTEEQRVMVNEEMIIDEWSPINREVLD